VHEEVNITNRDVPAAVKLMPTPPARVDKRKRKLSCSVSNLSIAFWRSLPRTAIGGVACSMSW
jgi:hypothetical protein